MKENRLKSWGFEEFPTEDPRIINYIGLESPENKMTSYEIFPGVFVLYISLNTTPITLLRREIEAIG